jgi:ribonuclease VapC
MILDTSALVAIVLREPGWQALSERIRDAKGHVAISAGTLTETAIVLSSRLNEDARGRLARLLHASEIAVIPFDEQHYGAALDGWLRYGKGRHPAALNFGDCIAYATSIIANEGLLCVGQDFSQTDCLIA